MRRVAARKKIAWLERWPLKKAWLLALIVFLGIAASILFYLNKTVNVGSYFASMPTHFSGWFAEKKQHINNKINKVRVIAQRASVSEPEPIHFEFYSTLPAIRTAQPESQLAASISSSHTVKANSVFKPQDIEKEFLPQLQDKHYVIQLGVFNNIVLAEKYRKNLVKAGVQVTVVTEAGGKKSIYRLQQGPFKNAAHAKRVQKKLQRLGVKSILRRLESA